MFEPTLHFVSVFLLPLSTSKQTSSTVVLAVFQDQHPCMTKQLQWTDIKATLENLTISFLENSKVQ